MGGGYEADVAEEVACGGGGGDGAGGEEDEAVAGLVHVPQNL